MGMDVFGNSGNYFRANIWSWRAILHALYLSGYEAPGNWGFNNGAGLSTSQECCVLADRLETFVDALTDDEVVMETDAIAVNEQGAFVDPGTPDSRSPYCTDQEHLREFVTFLRECEGFEIH